MPRRRWHRQLASCRQRSTRALWCATWGRLPWQATPTIPTRHPERGRPLPPLASRLRTGPSGAQRSAQSKLCRDQHRSAQSKVCLGALLSVPPRWLNGAVAQSSVDHGMGLRPGDPWRGQRAVWRYRHILVRNPVQILRLARPPARWLAGRRPLECISSRSTGRMLSMQS